MAYPNDMSRISDGLAKLEASSTAYASPAKDAARAVIRYTESISVAAVFANGANAINSATSPAVRMKHDGRVMGAYFIPQGAATASDTTYAVFALQKLDGTGNLGVTVANARTQLTGTGNTGNLVAAKSASLSVIAANARFARGYLLAAAVTQVSTGVATPAGTLCFDIEVEGTDIGNGSGYAV